MTSAKPQGSHDTQVKDQQNPSGSPKGLGRVETSCGLVKFEALVSSGSERNASHTGRRIGTRGNPAGTSLRRVEEVADLRRRVASAQSRVSVRLTPGPFFGAFGRLMLTRNGESSEISPVSLIGEEAAGEGSRVYCKSEIHTLEGVVRVNRLGQ